MPGFGSFASTFAVAAMAMSAQTTGAAPGIPHLQKRGTATQMIVDGKPFLMLAGELRNSTTSSLEFMKPVWSKLVALHLNTVLAAVQWELTAFSHRRAEDARSQANRGGAMAPFCENRKIVVS